jgi:hypothetical protein
MGQACGDGGGLAGEPKDAINQDDCFTCHVEDRRLALNPPHDSLPTTCQDCHSSNQWVPALRAFAHSWPLQGAHADTECASCHVGDPAVYAGTTTECVGCHQDDYDSSPAPGHDTFPTTCKDCHSNDAWTPALASLEHPWPLLGAHAQASCLRCHLGDPPVYAGTATNCVGCHQGDYNHSPFPGHETFPTTCADCHGNQSWVPASFDHAWPLQGAHAQASCQSCHFGNPPVYDGTPTTCVGCHQDDYDRSPFPGHDTFPTTCASCHTNQAWKPATGGAHPENAFPIQSGAHSRYRNDCVSCHNSALGSPIDGANADCVGCHDGEHRRTEMDAKHRKVANYPGGAAPPNFCLNCHPDGRN